MIVRLLTAKLIAKLPVAYKPVVSEAVRTLLWSYLDVSYLYRSQNMLNGRPNIIC